MVIYLSGSITNTLDYKEKFADAEKKMQQLFPTAKIINPAKVQLPENSTHADYMKVDFMFLDLADAICMLSGWECSKGACMEYGYAKAKNIAIMEMEKFI